MVQHNVLIEYIPQGMFVKVCAVDAMTGEEVSIVGDARQSREHLAQIAARKLRYVQQKKSPAKGAGD